MSKQKLMFYPFTIESLSMAIWVEKITDWSISSLVSLKGLYMNGKDAGFLDNRSDTGFIVTENLQESVQKCDTIVLCKLTNIYGDVVRSSVLDTVESCIKQGKNIVCLEELSSEEEVKFEAKCKMYNVNFNYFRSEFSSISYSFNRENMFKKLYRPYAPVVMTGGLIPLPSINENTFMLAHYLRKLGYRISVIGKEFFYEFMGFHCYPSWFFSQSCLSDSEKVVSINKFIKDIENTEHPDIIILQIPGGMMKYNDYLVNGFGIDAYLLSQAVTPDYFTCEMLTDHINAEFINTINDVFEKRFGFSIDSISVSNASVDLIDTKVQKKLSFLYMKDESIFFDSNGVQDTPIYKLKTEDDQMKISKCISDVYTQIRSAYSII